MMVNNAKREVRMREKFKTNTTLSAKMSFVYLGFVCLIPPDMWVGT